MNRVRAAIDVALSSRARKFHVSALSALFVAVLELAQDGPALADIPTIAVAAFGALGVYHLKNEEPA